MSEYRPELAGQGGAIIVLWTAEDKDLTSPITGELIEVNGKGVKIGVEGDSDFFTWPEINDVKLIAADQVWYWTPEWQAGEREVDEEIARGEAAGPYETTEECFAALEADE